MASFLQSGADGPRGSFRTFVGEIPASWAEGSAGPPDDLLGTTLGVYRLEDVIGAGSVGVVYRAWDPRGLREVAIKVLKVGLLASDDQRRRFRMEALALGRFAHVNVAAVLDFGTDGRRDYLVMELVPGQTLSAMVEGQVLASAHVVSLGEQLARGLAAAHAAGVIHRDIKPGNLRVTPEGRLQILDFGLATSARTASDTLNSRNEPGLVGTLPYMAPEQVAGRMADERTDVYGAGAVLYEMACGQRAFPHSEVRPLLDAIRSSRPISPSRHNPEIWPSLEATILKALARSPQDRFASAGELADHLARIAPPPAASGEASAGSRWCSTTGGVAALLSLCNRSADMPCRATASCRTWDWAR